MTTIPCTSTYAMLEAEINVTVTMKLKGMYITLSIGVYVGALRYHIPTTFTEVTERTAHIIQLLYFFFRHFIVVVDISQVSTKQKEYTAGDGVGEGYMDLII